MYPAAELIDCVLEEEAQTVPVTVVEEDRFAGITTENDMVDGAWIMDAGFAGHGGTIAEKIAERQA
jgi:hypothetical protein